MNNIFFLFMLLINNNEKVVTLRGEPLIFSISISAEEDIKEGYIENEKYILLVEYQNKKITDENYQKLVDSVSQLKIPEYSISGNDSLWANTIKFEVFNEEFESWDPLKWDLQLLYIYPDSLTIKIYNGSYIMADYGLNPESVLKLKSSLYKIRVKMKVYNLQKEIDEDAVSSEVTVDLKSEPANMDDPEIIQKLFYYYMVSNKFEKAIEEANKLFKMDVDSFQVYGFLGQIYERKQDYILAYKNYSEAISKIPPGTIGEYFDFFIDKIQHLQRYDSIPEEENK
jgi:tetratricopeptide (TPR) repeat protein